MKNQNKNTGLLIEIREGDYEFGSSPLQWEARNTTGNWERFLDPGELQRFRNFESMACVSFAATDSLECQVNWILENSLLSAEGLAFLSQNGYLTEGKCNFSDRFLAKNSGTTRNGNSFQRVWDSIRKDGLVPEIAWPGSEEFDWNEYYTEIPQGVKDLGLKFLEYFDVAYEKVNNKSDYKKVLQQAPIQIGTAVCPGWWDDVVVKACNLAPAHSTLLYAIDGSDYQIRDHYEPFNKELAKTYLIPYAYQGLISPIQSIGEIMPIKNNNNFLSRLLAWIKGLKK